MIIGNGMLARAFAAYATNDRYLIFASGVSDSTETRITAFQREETLLRASMQANPDKKLIYFSTCSIYDPSLRDSVYVQHKLRMEDLVCAHQRHFIIFRLPQVVGVTKSPTLVNFLYQKIITQQPFELWTQSTRYLIDVADVVRVIDYILVNQLFDKQRVNLATPQACSVEEIVAILERLTQRRGIYRKVAKGAGYSIDLSEVQPLFEQLGIRFDERYLERVLSKYYANV